MGCWNGVGGKIEQGEQPRASMLREIAEETNLQPDVISFKGLITWSSDGANLGGMYIYLAEIPEQQVYPTPIKTNEGILDWKELEWIMNPKNQGIATNIPSCLEKILNEDQHYDHHSIFENGKMTTQISTKVDSRIEYDENLRDDYLSRYFKFNMGSEQAFLNR
ncbi:8-oxo-dGTP diphosphatase [Paenibacillus eucommiae]|uniref:8-oxo-dGTP diphosphatase n=2 Tax=Paenibacillus eucommiae TaxID=1355755 RepID=A0ABS4IVK3_9BACL|nr:8-oxo-dGTP diphosphatase [Paenibacillus eucommiae]